MKIAIFIFAISCLLYFMKVKVEWYEYKVIRLWQWIKGISFLTMIGSFIAILIMI